MKASRRLRSFVLASSLLGALAGAGALPARAAASLTVNTTADISPPCRAAAFSLRCAIARANADGSGDTIAFKIPANAPGCAGTPAVCTLRPLHALPPLAASGTVIDGGSQPGSTPNRNPLAKGDNAVITLRLDGAAAGKGTDGLVIAGSHDMVKGLSITGFILCFDCTPIPGQQTGGSGVRLQGVGDVVAGNFIGVLPDGKTAAPNQFAAIDVASGGGPVGTELIGGADASQTNLISGNKSCPGGDCEGFGVYVESGSGTVIERNLIGTTASGKVGLRNTAGVVLLSAGNQLGGGTRASGNVISASYGDGVLVGAPATVAGNLIGTDATGGAALGNRSHGVDVQSSNVTVRDNVISANGDTGLVLGGGDTVQGNVIGTDISGRLAMGNGLHPSAIFLGQPINGTDGIVTCAGGNTIGGSRPGQGNLVSDSGGDGISLVSSDNLVRGNTIGTNATGTIALGNRVDGLGSRADIFKGTGFCQQAANSGGDRNRVGGAGGSDGNLISGNAGDGIAMVASHSGVIAGNRIGTDRGGRVALGNRGTGIVLAAVCDGRSCLGSSANTVGGTTPGTGNIIAGNAGNGVHIDGLGGGTGNLVQGNMIGTGPDGSVAIGNQKAGVLVGNGSVNDSIGGSSPAAGNTVAFNLGGGVLVGVAASDSGTHVAVRENSIKANGGLGIDIAPFGAVNCATPPPGPNDYVRCPLIQTATTLRVAGTACAGCTVDVFIATSEADDQGHGEGRSLLGSTLADGTGHWSLALSAGQVSKGQKVTATTTTPESFQKAAETSEFAANLTAG